MMNTRTEWKSVCHVFILGRAAMRTDKSAPDSRREPSLNMTAVIF
jgi:hypothetical protein